jgi:phosphatidate phosphatase APP1
MRALPILLLLTAAWPLSSRGETSVVLFPALGRPALVTVSGRVTHGTPERVVGPLERNARRLLTKSKERAAVSVSFAGRTQAVRTGEDGLFEASFATTAGAPFAPGLQEVRATSGGAVAASRVQVVPDAAPFLVVTDLDDTLVVTNVQSARGLARSTLLSDERTQPAVEGMAPFFRCLAEGNVPAPGFAVVSGSPLEFGPRVEGFLAKGGFPFAALVLRHLGPGTLRGYKEPAIRALLARFPHRVVLVGDSGERDPEIYAALRTEYPGRVAAIFIHDVGPRGDPARFEGMVLFGTGADAARAAAARGLLPAACVERAFPAAPATAP